MLNRFQKEKKHQKDVFFFQARGCIILYYKLSSQSIIFPSRLFAKISEAHVVSMELHEGSCIIFPAQQHPFTFVTDESSEIFLYLSLPKVDQYIYTDYGEVFAFFPILFFRPLFIIMVYCLCISSQVRWPSYLWLEPQKNKVHFRCCLYQAFTCVCMDIMS